LPVHEDDRSPKFCNTITYGDGCGSSLAELRPRTNYRRTDRSLKALAGLTGLARQPSLPRLTFTTLCGMVAASSTSSTRKTTATDCLRKSVSLALRELSQRDSMRLFAQAGRKVGSKSKIQIRRLQPELSTERSENSDCRRR
jgi:hypothetical protein